MKEAMTSENLNRMLTQRYRLSAEVAIQIEVFHRLAVGTFGFSDQRMRHAITGVYEERDDFTAGILCLVKALRSRHLDLYQIATLIYQSR